MYVKILEASMDKVKYGRLPYTFEGKVGDNIIYVRHAETATHHASADIEIVVHIDKWEKATIPEQSEVNIKVEGKYITIYGPSDIEASNDGTTFANLPFTSPAKVGENDRYIRRKENDQYFASDVRHITIDVDKFINQQEPIAAVNVVKQNVTVTGKPHTEASFDGVNYKSLPVTFTGEPGMATVYIRTKETDEYQPGVPKTIDVEIPKYDANPAKPVVSAVLNDDIIAVTSVESGIEANLNGGPYVNLPYNFQGVAGDNTITFRRKETATHFVGPEFTTVVTIDALPNPYTPSAVVAHDTERLISVTTTSEHPHEASLDGVQWFPLPASLEGQVGANTVMVRVSAHGDFRPSAPITESVLVPKLVNPATPEVDVEIVDDVFAEFTGQDVEVSVDGGATYHTLPLTEEFEVGMNTVYIRNAETEEYLAGEPVEFTFEVPKLVNDRIPSATHSVDEKDITVTGDGIEMTLDGGDTWVSLPHTFEGSVGYNEVHIRFKETDRYLAGREILELVIFVDKLGNPMTASPSDLEYVVDETEITVDFSASGQGKPLEFSIDGNVWVDLPHVFNGLVGENMTYVRFKGDAEYLPSEAVEVIMVVPKLVPEHGPEVEVVTTTVTDGVISFASSAPVEISVNGGTYRKPPFNHNVNGDLDVNVPFTVRYHETDTHEVSPSTSGSVFVPKIARPAPSSSIIAVNQSNGNVTVTSGNPDVEVSIDGSAYQSVPATHAVEGALGIDIDVSIRLVESGRFKASEETHTSIFVNKLNRPAPVEGDVSHSLDANVVTATSSNDDIIISINGGSYSASPASYTVSGELNVDATIRFRFKETDRYNESPATTKTVFVPKADRPAPLTGLVTLTDNGAAVRVTSTDDEIRASVNGGEWKRPPFTEDIAGDLARDIQVRIKYIETPVYNESAYNTKTVFVAKIDRSGPLESEANFNTADGKIVVTSSDSSMQVDFGEGTFSNVPATQVITGELGITYPVILRYAETGRYNVSAVTHVNVFVDKMDRPAPAQGDISYTVEGKEINITSAKADLVVSLNGGAFATPPVDYTVTGDLNVDVNAQIKFVENDRYKESPATNVTINVPKADRDAPDADVITLSDTGSTVAVTGGASDIEVSVDGGEWKQAPFNEFIPGDLDVDVPVRIRYIETGVYNPSEITTTSVFVAKLPQDPPTHDDYEIEIGQGSVTITQVFN